MHGNDTNKSPLPVENNNSQSVTLEGRPLIIARYQDQLFLYDNNCPHANETLDPMGGSLSAVSGDLLRCQRHGAEFLVQTGECVAGPCIGESLNPVPFTQVGSDIYLD